MINFRTEIRANEGVTKISKNKIVKIFLEKNDDKKTMAESLTQQKLLIFTNNPVGTAKVCRKFEKDSKKLSAEIAFFDKTLYSKEDIAKVATLPSLNEIRGKIVGLISAPASKLARVLLRPDQDIISILNNKKD
jgi:large subunit ribosomal protein L10